MHEFTVEAMVRGYHVYQTVWEVSIGEVLPCTREPGNRHNPHTVAVKKGDSIVVHLPRKISCICSIFIRGGSIECTQLIHDNIQQTLHKEAWRYLEVCLSKRRIY